MVRELRHPLLTSSTAATEMTNTADIILTWAEESREAAQLMPEDSVERGAGSGRRRL
jgi:hypothetical protein